MRQGIIIGMLLLAAAGCDGEKKAKAKPADKSRDAWAEQSNQNTKDNLREMELDAKLAEIDKADPHRMTRYEERRQVEAELDTVRERMKEYDRLAAEREGWAEEKESANRRAEWEAEQAKK